MRTLLLPRLLAGDDEPDDLDNDFDDEDDDEGGEDDDDQDEDDEEIEPWQVATSGAHRANSQRALDFGQSTA